MARAAPGCAIAEGFHLGRLTALQRSYAAMKPTVR